MKSLIIPSPVKPLAVQSCYMPTDKPSTDFEWFDLMLSENKIGVGDRKVERFNEDENGNIIITENIKHQRP